MQEFHIRHVGGSPISSEAERQRVIQCLQTAIDTRASEVFYSYCFSVHSSFVFYSLKEKIASDS